MFCYISWMLKSTKKTAHILDPIQLQTYALPNSSANLGFKRITKEPYQIIFLGSNPFNETIPKPPVFFLKQCASLLHKT